MDNIIGFPSQLPAGVTIDEERMAHVGEIPPGLLLWVLTIDRVRPHLHGLSAQEIARVEAFCSYEDVGFASADFVVRTHDERRFHIQCAVDGDNRPNQVAVMVVKMAGGQSLPFAYDPKDPTTAWSEDVGAFNIDLARIKASNIP